MPISLSKENIEQINSGVSLKDVFQEWVQDIKKSGISEVGFCPHCDKKKLTYTKKGKDEIVKCFTCDRATKNNPADLLHKFFGFEYPDNYLELIDRFNIKLKSNKRKTTSKKSFRDRQLRASGITEKSQQYFLQISSDQKLENNRYEKGSIEDGRIISTIDDMILHYIDLDNKPITYTTPRKKEKNYVRVRYENPDLHLDRKTKKPTKYRTPYGAGVKLWFPQGVINDYNKTAKTYKTLYVTEGEKKADVLYLRGLLTVGLSGIHNLSGEGQMPHQFQSLIKKFEVQNVVFLLDADYDELSIKDGKSVDLRPKTFSKAVIKFRDYFYAYNNIGIPLQIYFGYHIDKHFKGIDDLIVGNKDARDNINTDLESALIDRDGKGDFIQLHKITLDGDYKIRKYWHLHTPAAFIEHHKEQLKELAEFKLNGQRRAYNNDTNEIELIEKILKHEKFFYHDEEKKKTNFKHAEFRKFLKNRNFGRLIYKDRPSIFIKTEGRLVEQVNEEFIHDYVLNFCEQLEQPAVVELMLRGADSYMGPNRLKRMYPLHPEFFEPKSDHQFLIFNNGYWKITADEITTGTLADLPNYIWKDRVIDFAPELLDPMFTAEFKNNQWTLGYTDDFIQSDICRFYANTSNYHWKKEFELVTDAKGKLRYKKQPGVTFTKEEVNEFNAHLVSKMLATGYILHDYKQLSNMKAIVAMDGIESAVGESNGGTGKSLFSKVFEQLIKTFRIDAKDKGLSENRFLYEGVDERTQLLVFDDLRVNFDFEHFLNVITNGITVNGKGQKQFFIEPIKILMTTNHAINGEGSSYERRQYVIAFSDYYNEIRTPEDDLGRLMFVDWDYTQYNRFYNFMAQCIQFKLKHGLNYTIPKQDVVKRKLRQSIGEGFISWAEEKYDPQQEDSWVNQHIGKKGAYELFCKERKLDAKYIDVRKFKRKFQDYARYSGLRYNFSRDGERIKSSGVEYIELSNDDFDTSSSNPIKIEYPK